MLATSHPSFRVLKMIMLSSYLFELLVMIASFCSLSLHQPPHCRSEWAGSGRMRKNICPQLKQLTEGPCCKSSFKMINSCVCFLFHRCRLMKSCHNFVRMKPSKEICVCICEWLSIFRCMCARVCVS